MPLNNVAKIAKKNEMSFTVLKSVAVAVLLTYKTSRFKIKFKRPGQLQDLKSTAVHECQFSERFESPPVQIPMLIRRIEYTVQRTYL